MSTNSNDIPLGNLEGQLFKIPEEDLTELVAKLERRAQDPAKAPAVGKILDQLRPRLAILKPQRQATLVRFFAEPFADLLYTTGEPRKPVGRIPRTAIVPCYKLLQENSEPSRIQRYQQDLNAIEADSDKAMMELGTGFWRYASGQLRRVVVEAEKNKTAKQALIAKLGDPFLYSALLEIVGVLEVAVPVMQLRKALPATGMSHVTNANLESIRTALDNVHRQRPANAEFVVFVLLARLRNPAMIVEIMQRVEEAGTLADVSSVTNIANEAIVSQTEEKIRTLGEKIHSSTSCRNMALQAEASVKEVVGAASAIGNTGSRMQSRQLARTKSEMADLVRREMLEAQDNLTATNMDSLGGNGSARDQRAAQKGIEDRIISLRIASRFAIELGLDRDVNRRLAELEESVAEQSKKLLVALKKRDSAALSPEEAERQLFTQVRVTELLLGPEIANRLRLEGEQLLQDY
ncbi:hypothetical protein [Nisaea nitritireducens]|uniref:hypothetical protein n=1 Tax=Nisaea nitritireducens TaxID=568392 RepID=UPI0018686C5C|nr:hypothetical protein [Nisaea nitritireducens]